MTICTQVQNENSIMLYLDPETATPAVMARLQQALRAHLGAALIDATPAFHSLLLYLDIVDTIMPEWQPQLDAWLQDLDLSAASAWQPQLHEFAAYYGVEAALDAEVIAAQSGLDFEDCIALHCATVYEVQAIGFMPGFAYLGELDQRLQLPRRATPRVSVPAGSLAIANNQCAVYPQQSPGGWHIIGRCPELQRFAAIAETPLQTGDQVRFRPVTREEFIELGGELS